MDKRSQLTRTCASCGIEKPLSAFLQITGAHGTQYGTICSTCRGTGAREKKASTLLEEGQTTITSGSRIGAEAKVHFEKEQKRLAEIEATLNKEDQQNKAEFAEEKTQKTETREKMEKEHREFFLEAKKNQGFLSKTSTKYTEQKVATKFVISPQISEQERSVEAQKSQENMEQERKLTAIDLDAPVQTTQAGDRKLFGEGTIFRQFANWVGTSALGIGKIIESKPTSAPNATPASQQKKAAPESAKEEPLKEFVHKTWGPSSRK